MQEPKPSKRGLKMLFAITCAIAITTICAAAVTAPASVTNSTTAITANGAATSIAGGMKTTTLSASSAALRLQPRAPATINVGAQCPHYGAFVWVQGVVGVCMQGAGTTNAIGGPVTWIANSTGKRVWLHQYYDGSGWADCYNHGNTYFVTGRDQNPGNIYISNNSSQCPSSNPPHFGADQCSVNGPFAWIQPYGAPYCFQGGGTYNTQGLDVHVLTNGWGFRVWMHQHVDGSGWADCFDNNNAYDVRGTRDEYPGNVQLTGNTSPC